MIIKAYGLFLRADVEQSWVTARDDSGRPVAGGAEVSTVTRA